MAGRTELRGPDLGDFTDVEIVEVMVSAGDSVAAEDSLITLETDKATMDVPSPAAGTVAEISVKAGSTVSKGDLIAVIDTEESGADGAGSEGSGSGSSGADGAASGGSDANDSDVGSSDASGSDAPTAEATGNAPEAEPQIVTVPDLGDFSDVEVIEVLVAEGEEVEAEQGLITLETDKATMDVPSPVAGRILELKVSAGGKTNAGDAVALIQPSQAEPAAPAAKQKAPAAAPADRKPAAKSSADSDEEFARTTTALPAVGIVDETAFSRAHASPSVRKLARELGVDLGKVRPSGQKGRVTSDDVKGFVKRVMKQGGPGGTLPQVPEVDFAKFGPVETVKLTRIQKISGPRLHASWVNLPHVTQHDDADITDLEMKRQALKEDAAGKGIRLTPLAFIMRAVALTLEDYPQFRSSLGGDGLIVKNYFHIGFAADTPNGLVVPVIRDADRKDLFELASALGELSGRARDGKLGGADDVQGGVFTISSLGGIGGSYFTPIINAPEVAILGVSRSQYKPVYDGNAFLPRLMLPLSLSYDHRVIDGAEAARFITSLSATLGQVDKLTAAIP